MKNLNFVFGRLENIVGKGENVDYQHFLPFPQCFLKASFSRLLKVWIVWERIMSLQFGSNENCVICTGLKPNIGISVYITKISMLTC